MNAINVIPKQVVVVPARTAEINAVTWRTTDDAFRRRLHIVVNGVAPIIIEGEAYDALGQWTDETIKGLVLARLDLVVAVPA